MRVAVFDAGSSITKCYRISDGGRTATRNDVADRMLATQWRPSRLRFRRTVSAKRQCLTTGTDHLVHGYSNFAGIHECVFRFESGEGVMFGIVPAAAGTPDSDGVFYCSHYSTGYIFGAGVETGTTYAAGDEIAVRIDFDANTVPSARTAWRWRRMER